MSGIKPISRIEVTVFPRIHISLIGLNKSDYRINGGIGFSIDKPSLQIVCQPSSFFTIMDSRDRPLTFYESNKIIEEVKKISVDIPLSKSISITISGEAGAHQGFGSGTSIRLAIIESLLLINDIPYNQDLLTTLSKRGGTSGIGVNTYFTGSFVLDIGRKTNNTLKFLPSSENEKSMLPPALVFRIQDMPNWDIGICTPKEFPTLSQGEEVDFFQRTCPISDVGVHEILYHAIYGVSASVIESDFETFCNSINKIQLCEWKRAERALYKNHLIEVEKKLIQSGAKAVGLSSLGPTLYFLGDDIDAIIHRARQIDGGLDLRNARPVNHGRIIKYG